MTLIEIVAAIALLALIVTPVTRLIITTGSVANQDRLEVEAVNVATQQMEMVESEAQYESIPTAVGALGHVYTEQVTSNNGESPTASSSIRDNFEYTLEAHLTDEGGSASVCGGAGAGTPLQIWEVTVSVGWANNGSYPVKQVTYVAPQSAGVVPQNMGELAVKVSAVGGGPYLNGSVPITVTSQWNPQPGEPTQAPSPGPGEEVTGTAYTDDTGCAVFTNLDPDPGFTYFYALGTNSGVVSSQDYPGSINGGSVETQEMPPIQAPGVVAGSAVVASAIAVDPGETVTTTFSTVGHPPGPNFIAPYSDLPVTVEAQGLPMTSPTGSTDGSFVFETGMVSPAIQSIQLYPLVADANYGYDGIWAGDTADSYPQYTGYTGASPASVGSTATVPVWPMVLSMKNPPVGIVAKEYLAPNESIPLNSFVGSGTETSSTGVPLGQYQLIVTGHTVSPAWVWITPQGYCTATAAQGPMSSVCKTPTASGTPIALTVT